MIPFPKKSIRHLRQWLSLCLTGIWKLLVEMYPISAGCLITAMQDRMPTGAIPGILLNGQFWRCPPVIFTPVRQTERMFEQKNEKIRFCFRHFSPANVEKNEKIWNGGKRSNSDFDEVYPPFQQSFPHSILGIQMKFSTFYSCKNPQNSYTFPGVS